ncbi:MAG: NUDIX domain-containing protein [Bacteroidales bacterium]|nr:NUDIX domain-containing protein [Bacteroidales bacterium]
MLISYKHSTFRVPTTRWMWRLLTRRFRYVKAAGGVVTEPGEKLLLIYRNGRTDLPKGKVEANETLAQAAVREVEEETGLTKIACGPLLLKTYHIYNLYGGWHLKQTSWFAMSTDAPYPIVGQTEEGIEGGQWLPADQWRTALESSYGTMRIIVKHLFNRQP